MPHAGNAKNALTRAMRGGQFNSACATVTSTSVTFSNCTDTESGLTTTFNGSISVAAGAVTWGLTLTLSGTQDSTTVNLNMHLSGKMTVTATKVTGNSLTEFSGSASANGQSVSFGLDNAAIVDLTYQSSPNFCVTAGSVEVKRVWTTKPSGASGSAYADAGVKLTWTGCGAFTVAHST